MLYSHTHTRTRMSSGVLPVHSWRWRLRRPSPCLHDKVVAIPPETMVLIAHDCPRLFHANSNTGWGITKHDDIFNMRGAVPGIPYLRLRRCCITYPSPSPVHRSARETNTTSALHSKLRARYIAFHPPGAIVCFMWMKLAEDATRHVIHVTRYRRTRIIHFAISGHSADVRRGADTIWSSIWANMQWR